MSTATKPIDAVDLGIEELRATIDRYLNGVRDPEGRTKIAEQMDRIRESLPHDNTAVGLIREHRGPLPDQPLSPEERASAVPMDPEVSRRLNKALERAMDDMYDRETIRRATDRLKRRREQTPETADDVELIGEARREK